MTLSQLCQQALINLLAAKLRSFLAVLGILVGTAAIVALLSSGRLATEKALEQFKALGTDLLAVSTYQKSSNKSSEGDNKIALAAWRELPESLPEILKIAPYGTAFQQLSFQGRQINGAIVAADESLAEIIKIELSAGHFVSFVDAFEHYCVIGAGLARQLEHIRYDSLIGKQVHIGEALFTIIGIAKPWKENSFFNEDINYSVIIPSSSMALVNKDATINHAVMLIQPGANIDSIVREIRSNLSAKAPKLGIFIRSAKQIIASMESQGQIFTLLLAVIGSISLLVGGIGVMNVMLVSVSERKKEIGIRKAVGAKNREIQNLFLVEAVMLSMLGGALGVLIGLTLTWIIALFSHWTFTLFLTPILSGFAVSVAAGIFFGFYPARRAARLDAIVSLRSGV